MPRPNGLNMNLRSTAIAARLFLAMPLLTAPGWALAALASLADAPLGNGTSSTQVKPNVAMVVDDSGSMTDISMPDAADANKAYTCYGFKGYNTLAYDPTYTYKPPYDPNKTGNRFPAAQFNSALHDGYFADGATSYDKNTNANKNLNTDSNKPYAFTVKSGGKNVTTRYYYSTAKSNTKPGCDNNNYTAITDSTAIAGPTGVDPLDNYANWYSYYRQRNYLMKASTGEAFSGITDKYRVGLFLIHSGKDFVKVDDFGGDHRKDWYTKLYGHTYTSGTPLLGALSNMGRMYAGRHATYPDPVQYSCQQNFSILSTDGYWNNIDATSKPLNLDGTEMTSDQDGVTGVPPPYKDASQAKVTLSDVAYYYYQTDLRTTSNCSNIIDGTTYSNLCTNNVPGSGKDVNSKQHMTTFTLGLGVSGTLPYIPNYEADSATYLSIVSGSTPWPSPMTGGDIPEKIDDLWHAAVNGRGIFYSASNPTSLENGLRNALAGVTARIGSATAAATSNLEPVAGDNAIFQAKYRSVKWDGDLEARTIDPTSGVISTTITWSAQDAIDTQVSSAASGSDGRTIYYLKTSNAGKQLRAFTFDNLDTDGKASLFTNACPASGITPLSQCASLTAGQQTLANNGDAMVNYLRGRSTNEAKDGSTSPLYRAREHVLGDVVNAVPVYVKAPQFDYGKYDTTYSTFKSNNTYQPAAPPKAEVPGRAGTVYLAANDGMLHAINADNGQERWAYVPSFVMPNLRNLADKNYGANHQYSVDGSPTVADVCSNPTAATPSACTAATDWKTVLVAGLDKGGCGYYALDVTNPTSPQPLWEFTHDNLGYSYAPPVITRRKDGKWVAIVTSGYNNVPGTCGKTAGVGDGVGRVFVLDVVTGELLDTISTGAGDADTPSNLGKLNAWVENAQLNTADALYGGDMLGNLWRIDFDNNHGTAGKEATLLATLQDAVSAGNAQPITVKPELAFVGSSRVVMVGTGRYLSTTDQSNTLKQSLYAIKDDLTATPSVGNPRANDAIKARTFTNAVNGKGQNIRTLTGDAVNWSTDKGWYVDFDADGTSPGERVNVDMQLQYNILTVATSVPEVNVCTSGGYSWLYYVDIDTGLHLTTAADSAAGVRLSSNAMVSGIRTVKLKNGKTVTIVSDSDGGITKEDAPSPTGSGATAARRTMWREIPD